VHDTGTWNGDKKAGMVAWSWQVISDVDAKKNVREGEMATTNAQVNELVALQADMLLKAAEVRDSHNYWDSAEMLSE